MPPTFHQEDIEERAGTIHLPEYHDRIVEAQSRADNERIAELCDEYHQERMKLAEQRMRKEAGVQESDPEKPQPDRTWDRPSLNEYARTVGIEDPEDLRNKQAVLQAIEEVGESS